MGLSQRKVKQRIGPDPRNLSWGDDAARFGQAYLEKLGWSSGGGLGASGEGRTTHISVKQKLNLLGIGGEQSDPTVAWKQGRDFEHVLAKLNGTAVAPESAALDGFAAATQVDGNDAQESTAKKRKKDGDDVDGERKRKKARSSADGAETKEERKRRKEEKKRRKAEATVASATADASVDSPAASTTATVVPRHRHHRAKFLKSKRMANGDAVAMAQILGIAPSSTPAPQQKPDPDVEDARAPSPTVLGIDDGLIKTSTKSVADYFKEKMEAIMRSDAQKSTITPATTTVTQDPPPADDYQVEVDENEDKRRRKQEKKVRKEQKRKAREVASDD